MKCSHRAKVRGRMTTKVMHGKESGQALIELSFALVILCVFVCGIIDFGRAIYDVQVMKNLVGEGSSMASRGTTLGNTVTTVTADAGKDLSMSTAGCVMVTAITNMGGGTIQVTGQSSGGGISCTSKVGCLKGQGSCGSSTATLPALAVTTLTSEVTGSTIYATEIFYNFHTITPITALLGSSVMPSQFYAVAYY
jgi:Flp pilus assembly protein TadG